MYSLKSRPARQHAVHTAVFSLVMAGSILSGGYFAQAGESTISLAEQEIQRRTSVVTTQHPRLAEAEAMLRNGETEAALKIFEEVYLALPDVRLAHDARAVALDGYIRAGLMRAQELANAGNYPAANALLDKLDSPAVAKGERKIARLRARIADPDRFPPALTPEHVANVAEVQTLLSLGNSQRETGQHDKALLTYEEVLRIDPYNSAARQGMLKTETERTRYFDQARDHTRSKMLNEVNAAWEATVPLRSADLSNLFGGNGGNTTGIRGGRETIQQKLRSLKIARIDFSGAALDEVVEYLRVRSRDLDPEKKGIDFVVSVPADYSAPLISLNLSEVPLEDVVRYVTQMANLTFRVEDYAVRLVSASEGSDILISKSYKVPPDFITRAPVGEAGAAPSDPFSSGNQNKPSSGLALRRLGAQEFLASYGVSFGEGASATYNSGSSLLMVRNTASNLETVDLLVEQALNRTPKQVVVDVRMVEVGDNRLTEIGFDWLLGSFGSSVQTGGGTVGNGQNSNYLSGDFPFQTPTGPVGANPVTAGLRSSGDLTVQGVDGVLFGSEPSISRRSPGVLSLSGVLTDPQFQGVLRALDQKKGVDMLSQPSVIARSGQQANLEIVRELIYPTEFDPPQIPTNIGSTTFIDADTGELLPTEVPPIPVTPTTPTAFEMRKTGVILNLVPEISEDARTVDLTITPEFTEFAGFVNYGTPITTVTAGESLELTPNLIFQPIFDSKRVVTSVKIWDGATVVLGGLVTDREETIQDKVPVLGDLPFIGRMFKSNVKDRRMRHMVIFVTVRVVDPSGARVNPGMN